MFKKLNEVAEGSTDVFTIRGTKVWLKRCPQPTVIVEISNNPEVLTSSRERREHFATASPWLAEQLKTWEFPQISEIEIARPGNPLEVLCGNVGLILVIEGRKYLYSVYRDIFPKGWLLPGGCSHLCREIMNPREVAFRESREEILVADKSDRVYRLVLPNSKGLDNELMENIDSWQKERALPTKVDVVDLKTKELLPIVGHARNLIVRINGQENLTQNVSVVIDSEIAILEVNCYLEVSLPIDLHQLRLFDCERLPNGNLLNRPTRLTDVNGNVAAEFSRGDNITRASWITPAMEYSASIP
ncbi:MAG: hypothetical protein ABIG40_00760 [Parcubacteria group bacterium]